MSVTSYWPPYPDLQTLSAAFNASGNILIVTKFRRINGVQIQPLLNLSTAGYLNGLGPWDFSLSNNAGTVTAQLCNASTQISSTIGVNIWVTGVM